MKSFKGLLSSLLLVLVTCSVAQVQAGNQTDLPVYQQSISGISLSYEDSMLGGSIKLDNGMTLRIVDYKTRDDNVMKTWQPGDVVALKAQVKDDALVVSTKRITGDNQQVELYVISDVTKEPKGGLVIVEINDEGKFVRLSDNSVWEFSWYNRLATKKWKTGEHVIVQGQGQENSYEFINLDAPVTLNVASANATFISH